MTGRRYPARDFGPLPVAAVGASLGIILTPGRVRLSARAHRHIAEDHPDDYAACISALPAAVATPTFAGQAPHHRGNFEIVRDLARPDGQHVLVAIGLRRDADGCYRVRSCYLIAPAKVARRRRKNWLRPVAPPP